MENLEENSQKFIILFLDPYVSSRCFQSKHDELNVTPDIILTHEASYGTRNCRASSLSKLRSICLVSIRFVYFNVCVLLISTCAKLSYKGKSSPLPFHWNIFCFSDGYTRAYIRFGYWSRCYCSSEQRIVNWKIIPARFSVTISRSLEIALHFDQDIDQGERERKKSWNNQKSIVNKETREDFREIDH